MPKDGSMVQRCDTGAMKTIKETTRNSVAEEKGQKREDNESEVIAANWGGAIL